MLTVAGLLGYQHVVDGTRPAVVEVEPRLADVRREAEVYYLPVEVINRGDLTAGDVRVRLRLASEASQEFADLLIPLLAGGATAHGTAVFRADPSAGRLAVDSLSFPQP
jgi:uncharacterized protein (TIGR02588 family)